MIVGYSKIWSRVNINCDDVSCTDEDPDVTVLRFVASQLNEPLTFVDMNQTVWHRTDVNGSKWNGDMGVVHRGEVDTIAGTAAHSPDRFDDFLFSHTVYRPTSDFLVRAQDNAEELFVLRVFRLGRIFQPSVWLAIVFLMLCMFAVLLLKNLRLLNLNAWTLVGHMAMQHVITTNYNVSCPLRRGTRLLVICSSLLTMFSFVLYQNSLSAALVMPIKHEPPLSSIEQLVEKVASDRMNVAFLYKGTSIEHDIEVSTDPNLSALRRGMHENSRPIAYEPNAKIVREMVLSGEYVAVVTSNYGLAMLEHNFTCSLTSLPVIGLRKNDMAFMFKPTFNRSMLRRIDQVIIQNQARILQLINRRKIKIQNQASICHEQHSKLRSVLGKPFDLWPLLIAYIVLGLGVASGCVAVLIETARYYASAIMRAAVIT